MYKHVKDKKVIWSTLNSFTKGESCLTNPMTFYDEMTGLVDERTPVVVYLDFSEVFDMVSHSILIIKLAKYAPDKCTCMAELPGSKGDHQHKRMECTFSRFAGVTADMPKDRTAICRDLNRLEKWDDGYFTKCCTQNGKTPSTQAGIDWLQSFPIRGPGRHRSKHR
ncbi:rna-directed dna polymerase from mobile element jockey- hypothetical protein [Limosa lapponica baueri]|uniref:Rna-directed dna polymerase from mobile element jockey-like n=1 Tax=Limosa lapponica baueri TaxID=1758121 RepID=A0A2I0TKC6_LIMLA|nr:rna-directed dna polymerase from mobile element jockey- hypothetical protein [Limosa lapponica baueri]